MVSGVESCTGTIDCGAISHLSKLCGGYIIYRDSEEAGNVSHTDSGSHFL